MYHRVKRLCCISVLALVTAFVTGVAAQAQLLHRPNEARVMLLDGNGDPLPQGLMTISGSDGTVLTPAGEEDGAFRFTNVGRKLILEFANRGPKNVPIEVVLIEAPSVFVSIRVDPATGTVKEILQKPQFLAPGPRGKVRSYPGGGQQALVPPANNACATPTAIFNGATPFSTVDATTDGIPPGCSGTANVHNDIWFDYIATGTGTLTVETCNAATFDTKIAIYNGLACPTGLPIGCNDDGAGCASFTSRATAPVVLGNHYLIRVGGFASTTPTGTGTLTIIPPAAPPAFDDCLTAPTVGCNSSTVFNNSAATTSASDPIYSCRVGGPAQGFGTSWFKFVATAVNATIDTNGSLTGDTLLGVYSGTCGAFVEIGCDDDNGIGLLSSVTVAGLTIGQTYYIQASGWGASNVGTNTLNVSCSGPPPGDSCDDPIAGSCDSSVTVDLTTMSVDPTDPLFNCRVGGATQGNGTAWISFVATDTSVRVHTNDSLGTGDTLLAVYDGTCGALVELCCDDDSGVGFLSELCCEGLIPGNTYLIEVAAWSAGSLGEATVTIQCPCPAPPANDECEDAIALGFPPTSVTFDTTLATDDIGSPCGVGSGPFSNVWYTINGTGNTITATTCNPGTSHPDTKISVFCGECGALVCVTGNDDDGGCGFDPFFSTLSWCSQSGATYLVTIGGFASGQQGVVELSFTDDGTPCEPLVQCLPVGGCCLADGSCVDATQGDCLALDGVYQGDGTSCNVNAVQDPSFEQSTLNFVPFAHFDSPEWLETSTNFLSPTCSAAFCGTGTGTGPRTGIIWSWFGGINAFEEGTMEQLVTIPVGASTLDFYLEIPFTSGNGVDFLEVTIDAVPVFTVLESAGPYLGYQLVQVPLGAFADGLGHYVVFHSIITGSPQGTNFFVDDVSIDSQSIFCPQPNGACCLIDGSCVEVTEEECGELDGIYNGDFSLCVDVSCPQPLGACCLSDGSCASLTEEDCLAAGGSFNGDFTSCEEVTCITCYTLDFETDDQGNSMAHGAIVDTEYDGGPNYPVTITGIEESSGLNTCAILNSSTGPAAQDPDLLVGNGNILILQNDVNLTQCGPGVYCTHNDDEDGGSITFAFNQSTTPASIVIVDQDSGDSATTVVLTDSSGDTRTYTVPPGWTGDLVTDATSGMGTLDLTTLAAQPGFAGSATAVQDPGYDPDDVVQIVVTLGNSGGVDDLSWCQ